jgi:hypothetical protein
MGVAQRIIVTARFSRSLGLLSFILVAVGLLSFLFRDAWYRSVPHLHRLHIVVTADHCGHPDESENAEACHWAKTRLTEGSIGLRNKCRSDPGCH